MQEFDKRTLTVSQIRECIDNEMKKLDEDKLPDLAILCTLSRIRYNLTWVIGES